MKSRRFFLFLTVLLSFPQLKAQDPASCGDWQFREMMNAFVSEGNRQYDKSSRTGIMAMADALDEALQARSQAGRLNRTDSLEYTADWYKLLGDWHYENGNYDQLSFPQSEEQFLKALAIYSREDLPFREDLDKIPMIYRELAQLYYRQERYPEALTAITKAACAYENAWKNQLFFEGDPEYYTWLDLKTQRAICLARASMPEEALALIDEVLGRLPDKGETYYETLRKKAKILMLTASPDCAATASPLYQAYFDWRRSDALNRLSSMNGAERQEYWMRMRPFLADCYQLEDANPKLVFNAALFGKGLLLQLNRLSGSGVTGKDALNTLKYEWQDIQKKLPADACVIEFVQYENAGSRRMGALVLGRKGNPVWIPVAAPDSFLDYKINGVSNRDRVYSTHGKRKDPMYLDEDLKSFIWNDAIITAIGGCKKVYFVPDGYLHQLAVEYMLPERLAGKEFYRLTSSRRLMEAGDVDVSSALIVGGVRYNEPASASWEGNDSLAFGYLSDVHARFSYLPGSKYEAESIRQLRDCPADTLLLGTAATETAIRALAPSFPLICLSTHGFFCAAETPQGTDLKPCLEEHTLSQSILALAGANACLSDSSFNPSRTDGLLSAAEIGMLDLSGVDLAVISACQTGLGMVTGDGVFGIQRGLKNAGVDCMVLSLWNVDDKATSLFMSRFHQLLAEGNTIHEAFYSARDALPEMASSQETVRSFNPGSLSKRPLAANDDYNLPCYKDAFILIDAIY